MTSAISTALKPLLLVGMMATASFASFAQTTPANPPAGQPGAHHGMMHKGDHDPAKRQAKMVQRQAELKAKLQLNASQEGAWNTFAASMKPPARTGQDHAAMRAEMEKLSTPERIDRMKALRAQRDAEVDKRADAAKTFYATLNADQKKVFDAQPKRGGRGHGGGHGGEHGRG